MWDWKYDEGKIGKSHDWPCWPIESPDLIGVSSADSVEWERTNIDVASTAVFG